MNPIEMRQERAKMVTQARELLERAEAEKRDLTAEEQEQYDKYMADIEARGKAVEREERMRAIELETRAPARGSEVVVPGTGEKRDKPELRAAFNRFLRSGLGALSGDEQRALQADADIAGGYLVPPEMFVNQLIQGMDNQVFVRQLATKFQMEKAESLGVPALDTDIGDVTWTTELLVGTEDSTMTFGKRELSPKPLARYIKVSNKLLRQAAFDVEGFVRQRLAYKFGTVQENAFLNGTGVNQPLGVFTASALGISTGRDVSTDNTTTAITADGLINTKFALKPQYRGRAQWLFHTDAVKMISKLKDGEGQYLWQPGIAGGVPDRILQMPYMESLYAPNTFTAALYVGILGDWSYYWIVDALDVTIQRLVELYAATNQTGFIGRLETDGMPVLEEAFARVKLLP